MAHTCPYCESTKTFPVNTYKHYWVSCSDCNNVHRVKKDSFFWDRGLTKALFSKTKLKHYYANWLLTQEAVKEDKTKAYEYYVKTLEKGFETTKWKGVPERIFEKIGVHGIDIKGKRILDISGGPGHVTYAAKGIAERAIVTELSEPSVKAMRKTLGIEAAVFDYNTHSIEDQVEGTFDVVFINYSIGYCNDLRAFAKSLKKLMHEGSHLYIAYSPPTLGLYLRWQFSPYPYTRCWQYETIAKVFAEIGMVEVALEDESAEYYNENKWTSPTFVQRSIKKLLRWTAASYKRKALRSKENFNRELYQKNVRHIFKFDRF